MEAAHNAVMTNMGQCCIAGSRTFVHEDIYDEFVRKSRERALKRVVGDPWENPEQGPQVGTIKDLTAAQHPQANLRVSFRHVCNIDQAIRRFICVYDDLPFKKKKMAATSR